MFNNFFVWGQNSLVTTTFVKPHLSCDLNFVMKRSHEWLLPWATATTFGITQLDFFFGFKLFLATTQTLLHLNQHFSWNCTLSLWFSMSISDIKTLICFCFMNYKLVSKPPIHDHPLLFNHVVTYKSSFLEVTSSSYDHFFEFLRRSLMRALTVIVSV